MGDSSRNGLSESMSLGNILDALKEKEEPLGGSSDTFDPPSFASEVCYKIRDPSLRILEACPKVDRIPNAPRKAHDSRCFASEPVQGRRESAEEEKHTQTKRQASRRSLSDSVSSISNSSGGDQGIAVDASTMVRSKLGFSKLPVWQQPRLKNFKPLSERNLTRRGGKRSLFRKAASVQNIEELQDCIKQQEELVIAEDKEFRSYGTTLFADSKMDLMIEIYPSVETNLARLGPLNESLTTFDASIKMMPCVSNTLNLSKSEHAPRNDSPRQPFRMDSRKNILCKSEHHQFSLSPKQKFNGQPRKPVRLSSTDEFKVSEHSVELHETCLKPSNFTKTVLRDPYDSMATFADSFYLNSSPKRNVPELNQVKEGISNNSTDTFAVSVNLAAFPNKEPDQGEVVDMVDRRPKIAERQKTLSDSEAQYSENSHSNGVPHETIMCIHREAMTSYFIKRKQDVERQVQFHRRALEDLEEQLQWLSEQIEEAE